MMRPDFQIWMARVKPVALVSMLFWGLSLSCLAQAQGNGAGDAVAAAASSPAPASTPSANAQGAAAPEVKPLTEADNKTLKAIDDRYQKAVAVTMAVQKELKLGLLGQTRSSKGKLQLSNGRLRMELEGAEKSLLVVGKRKFWSVLYPAAEFKKAVPQVITGDFGTKKARSQSPVAALITGGLTKSFKATGVQAMASGEAIYFLQPNGDQMDIKRAQVTLSKDRKKVTGFRYWDERDNESIFVFSEIQFGQKALPEKLFNFVPPVNADVMNY
jgi:outer membrane lipoprotein-sorting protein